MKKHEVNETSESQAPTTRTLDRKRKHPVWHSDYSMESNEAMKLKPFIRTKRGNWCHYREISSISKEQRMKMSRVPYVSTVGSLMFAMIYTRLDIAHTMGVVSRYMAEPGREHWEAVKRILRYIKGTLDVELCDLDGSKSTTGYVFTLFGGT
nr:Gag-Pol polyprotein [Tanacetum cinerariifolium]